MLVEPPWTAPRRRDGVCPGGADAKVLQVSGAPQGEVVDGVDGVDGVDE